MIKECVFCGTEFETITESDYCLDCLEPEEHHIPTKTCRMCDQSFETTIETDYYPKCLIPENHFKCSSCDEIYHNDEEMWRYFDYFGEEDLENVCIDCYYDLGISEIEENLQIINNKLKKEPNDINLLEDRERESKNLKKQYEIYNQRKKENVQRKHKNKEVENLIDGVVEYL